MSLNPAYVSKEGKWKDWHAYLVGMRTYRTLYGARQACKYFGLPINRIWFEGRRLYGGMHK